MHGAALAHYLGGLRRVYARTDAWARYPHCASILNEIHEEQLERRRRAAARALA